MKTRTSAKPHASPETRGSCARRKSKWNQEARNSENRRQSYAVHTPLDSSVTLNVKGRRGAPAGQDFEASADFEELPEVFVSPAGVELLAVPFEPLWWLPALLPFFRA